ncbi:MAG: SLC13 family permease, partial [Candidatus Zixiibacteriota bacterium]
MITGQFLITIVIFLAVYISIISEKVHRTVSAMAGAITLIVLGILNQVEAIDSIDFNTIGLLIGMMVIMGMAKKSGMFQYLAIYA